jgi:alpha-methylacyl-CoA racemase
MGPLLGVKVVEFGSIGPGPFCCMLLADMGAEVVRVDRTEAQELGSSGDPKFNVLNRGRKSIAIDLKKREGVATARRLIAGADAVVEGFRPGVMERLGLGPDESLAANPALVYGRMTGWGQTGPLSQDAGHDINYIALAGALHCIGPKDGVPIPPLNLVGDFGGGALFLALGICAALFETAKSGKGQVIDAAMVDGVATLMTGVYASLSRGALGERGTNLLDGGAPWYGVYETKDGKYISIGSIESKFYGELLRRMQIGTDHLKAQFDRSGWDALREQFARAFKLKSRDEWCEVMQGGQVCFAPVLTPREAVTDPHLSDRGVFVERDGVLQPAPAPRFSRTRSEIASDPSRPGEHTAEVLRANSFSPEEIDALLALGAVRLAGSDRQY